MASIIKVDQIQSDSGNVSLTGNLSSTTITTSTLSSTTGNVTVTSNVSVVGLQTSSNVSVAGKTLIDSTGRQYSVIGAGTTLFEEYKCRAWVNFNGTGTPAIRGSGNVSSITDNGEGDYTVNFATAMPDANYSAIVCGSRFTDTPNWYVPWIASKSDAVTSSNCRIEGNTWNGYPVNSQDIALVMVSIFR
jgi:hypothetical protein